MSIFAPMHPATTHGRLSAARIATRVCVLLAATGLLCLPPATRASIVINEIFYNAPQPWPPTQEFPTSNPATFIEILNTGSNAVPLANYRFDQGISYNFPSNAVLAPGAFLVICQDPLTFATAYPGVTNVIGPFNGNLANSGERVTLSRRVDDSWVTVDTIKYIDDASSDGTGRSLELIHPGFATLRDHYFGDWAASLPLGGTPGAPNSVFNPAPPAVAGGVTHDPAVPPAGSAMQVTARVATWHGAPPTTVLAEFRKDVTGFTWTNTPMRDDGIFPDQTAGDGLYTIMLPPHDYPAMTEGQLMEFRIAITDGPKTSRFPGTNRTENLPASDPLSYLCFFGTDPQQDVAYPGEYPTYRILLTSANLAALGNQPSKIRPRDATLITPDGNIFYNGSTRGRGSGSSGVSPYNYRFDLPGRDTYDNLRSLNFNHLNARQQHFGMRIVQELGEGTIGLDTQLCRLWLNNNPKHSTASEGLYHRIEGINRDFLDKRYPNVDGNLYNVSEGFSGSLSLADLPAIPTRYDISIYNPYWGNGWMDLTNLIIKINSSPASMPSTLPTILNPRQWARLFAGMVALDNREAGFYSPNSQNGDELRLYINSDRKADLFPWDMDAVVGAGARLWGWTLASVTSALYNAPTIYYYLGDLIDIVENVMSDQNLNAIFDSMGSKHAVTRNTWLATIRSQRTNLRAALNHNLTVNGLGNTAFSLVGLATNNMPGPATFDLLLTGLAPQPYTAAVLVNDSPAQYSPRPSGAWALTNALPFTAGIHPLQIHTRDPEGRILTTRDLQLIVSETITPNSGTLPADTLWSATQGVFYVSANLTIPAGRTLTLTPGTIMTLAAGAQLVVEGTLALQGTPTNPVSLYPHSGTTPWSIAVAPGATASINHTQTRGGHLSAAAGATLNIDNTRMTDSTHPAGILACSQANVTIRRSIFQNYVTTTFSQGTTLIDECLFEGFHTEGLVIANSTQTSTVSRTTLRLGTPTVTNAITGIRMTNLAAGLIQSCEVQQLTGTGIVCQTSTVALDNSLLAHLDTGIAVSGTSSVTADDTTIAHTRQAVTGAPQLQNAILWNHTSPDGGQATTISFSDVQMPGNTLYPGTANLNREPFFRDAANHDYRLQPYSPALGTGSGATDMGPAFPVGAAPATPLDFTIASITPSAVTLTWTDADARETGFELERSLDGITWSLLATLPADSTLYLDNTVSLGQFAAYRLRAHNPRLPSFYTDALETTDPIVQTLQDLIDGLRITEIMYHPSTVGTTNHHRDLEFLEFQNIGEEPLDLSGLNLESGMFVFGEGTTLAPGAILLLISNPGGFEARYPGVPYHGVFAVGKNLSNSGEVLDVVDGSGNVILSFLYRDSWYPSTDGGGYSLVLSDPFGDLSSPLSWLPSGVLHGTPGFNDPPAFATLVINEILAHTDLPFEDAIELYNQGSNAVNIAGWYLSDTRSDPLRYQIPPTPAITIPPGGYHVFYEGTSFNSNTNTGFALSSFGERVILSSGDGTQFTGYRTHANFPASENGVSFGRHPRSDGKVDFVPLSQRTFGSDTPTSLAEFRTGTGASNAYPQVGPVVINELMYAPTDAIGGLLEFVELVNLSSNAVPLFTTNHTWFFSAGIDYTFPSNITLDAGEYILISGVPEPDLRAAYGLTNTNLRIFGPFDGRLANSGEQVTLSRPGKPDAETGFIPFYTADTVTYGYAAPWPPAANRRGPSLEKRDPALYGNDPANWTATTTGGTPGKSNNTAALPSVAFTRATTVIIETNTTITVEVTRQPATATTVTVDYFHSGGSALPGSDFTLTPGTLTFWPYETSKTFTFNIVDDQDPEPDETIEITIGNVSSNAILGGNRRYTCTIIDTDGTTLPPPAIIPPTGMDFTFFLVVSMQTGIEGGDIFYTLDGTLPTRDSTRYLGPFVLDRSAQVHARLFLGSLNVSPSTEVVFREQAPTPGAIPPNNPSNIFQTVVLASNDDARQIPGLNPMSLTDPTLTLARTGDVGWGFRFRDVNIARGSIVSNAHIQFVAAATNSLPVTLSIRAHATDDAPPFGSGYPTITTRPKTTNVVTWTPESWAQVDDHLAAQRTPNLAPLLTEIFSRTNWSSGNAVALLIQPQPSTGTRELHTFDGNPTLVPLLYIDYLPGPTVAQAYLQTLVNGSGSVSGGNRFFNVGQTALVTATPATYYHFADWSGETGGANTNLPGLSVLMDQNRTVTARFLPDRATLGTPHGWLATTGHNTNDFNAAELEDLDDDLMLGWEEYIAGTDPNNPESRLATIALEYLPESTRILWHSVQSRFYTLYRMTNLLEFGLGNVITSSMPASVSGTNEVNDTDDLRTGFYRLGVSTNR